VDFNTEVHGSKARNLSYSYLYHKCYVFLIISYVFSSTKSKREEQVLPRKWEGEVAQTMYTHVSKYKNDKINKEKMFPK
jgi:hypothetical protein